MGANGSAGVLSYKRSLALDHEAADRARALAGRVPELRVASVLRAAVRIGLGVLEADPTRLVRQAETGKEVRGG